MQSRPERLRGAAKTTANARNSPMSGVEIERTRWKKAPLKLEAIQDA
jgi:hypothetical protein